MKKSIKIILSVFVLLCMIFIIINIRDSASKKSTFKSVLADVDTNTVSLIVIKNKNITNGIDLVKTDSVWNIIYNNKTFLVDKLMIDSILQQIDIVKPRRIASKQKISWAEYEVNDSLGTLVSIYDQKNKK
ncbi:MAG: hypothetical protein IPO21_08845 [Bacteroidales bacterium]|nr:hypothetical protein [Bacteroidales bacterium]